MIFYRTIPTPFRLDPDQAMEVRCNQVSALKNAVTPSETSGAGRHQSRSAEC